MTTIDKLKKKLKARPKTFDYRDAKRILEHEGYAEDTGGKTSGSKVMFKDNNGTGIVMHKPHPESEMKSYSIDDVATFLENEGKL